MDSIGIIKNNSEGSIGSFVYHVNEKNTFNIGAYETLIKAIENEVKEKRGRYTPEIFKCFSFFAKTLTAHFDQLDLFKFREIEDEALLGYFDEFSDSVTKLLSNNVQPKTTMSSLLSQ